MRCFQELYQEKSEINRKGPFQNKVEEKKEDLSLPKSVPNTSRGIKNKK